jgi:hypothetical protein
METKIKPGPVSQKSETAGQSDRAKLERKLTLLRRLETGFNVVALGSALVGVGGIIGAVSCAMSRGNEAAQLSDVLRSEKGTLEYFDQKIHFSYDSLGLSLSPGTVPGGKLNYLAKTGAVIPALEELRAKNGAALLASSNAIAQVNQEIKKVEDSPDYKAFEKKKGVEISVSLGVAAMGLSFASLMAFVGGKIERERGIIELSRGEIVEHPHCEL